MKKTAKQIAKQIMSNKGTAVAETADTARQVRKEACGFCLSRGIQKGFNDRTGRLYAAQGVP